MAHCRGYQRTRKVGHLQQGKTRHNVTSHHTIRLRRKVDTSWRALRLLNLYRWIIGVGLTVLFASGVTERLFDLYRPTLFGAVCAVYLALCLLATIATYRRTSSLKTQAYLLAGIDTGFVAALLITGGGIQSGLGLLMLAPIAGAGALVSRRMAMLLAAVASIILLLEESWRLLHLATTSADFFQAGLLGVLLFAFTLLVHELATRVRFSTELAASRKTELDDLNLLNERIVEQMRIGVIVLDGTQHIRTMNAAAQTLLGSPAGTAGQLLDTIAPGLRRALDAWQHAPHLTTKPFATDTHSIVPGFSRLGHTVDAPTLIFLEDAGQLNKRAQQMKLASLGRLTASIAHEIRNPLSAISQAGQLLHESGHIEAQDRRLLDIIHRQTRRLDDIVNNVLNLSRKTDLQSRQLPLGQWLAQTIDDYQVCADSPPKIQRQHIADTLTVETDPGHLTQILHSLWDNAKVHARVADRQLVITVSAGYNQTGEPYLEVADNGPGIDAKSRDKILEPFYTTSKSGTGLGLYVCNELCTLNRIHFSAVTPPLGVQGACFRLVFPGENGPAFNRNP